LHKHICLWLFQFKPILNHEKPPGVPRADVSFMDSWGIKCCILSDLYVKNNSLFWGVLLQKASVLMESGWKEPLILSDTMHALSSAILYYPAWALFLSFNSCIKIKNLCLLFFFCFFCFLVLFSNFTWIQSCSHSGSSTISLFSPSQYFQNHLFYFFLYLDLAFLCWVLLLIGMLNIQHCRLWESVAGWGNEGLQFDWQGEW